ncbi:MAG: acetyl-CoA carboxylase, biotin carboxyl carrier protein [Armatimonadetes bacterium]|nr:acetyl-CoA carboxylase, biotin carboxyl carrier protein [Armatimonadota bacterium]
MVDLKSQITELAQLMEEFGLEEAKISSEDWLIEFSRKVESSRPVQVADGSDQSAPQPRAPRAQKPSKAAEPTGTPISSPMTGIYYSSPSPDQPAFVKEGDMLQAGQIIGLIEAMKVFSEIPSPLGGRVLKMAVENGQLVEAGAPLLFVG